MFHVEHGGDQGSCWRVSQPGAVPGRAMHSASGGCSVERSDEPAVGGDAGLGVGEGLLHVVDGAEGDGVEAAGGG